MKNIISTEGLYIFSYEKDNYIQLGRKRFDFSCVEKDGLFSIEFRQHLKYLSYELGFKSIFTTELNTDEIKDYYWKYFDDMPYESWVIEKVIINLSLKKCFNLPDK